MEYAKGILKGLLTAYLAFAPLNLSASENYQNLEKKVQYSNKENTAKERDKSLRPKSLENLAESESAEKLEMPKNPEEPNYQIKKFKFLLGNRYLELKKSKEKQEVFKKYWENPVLYSEDALKRICDIYENADKYLASCPEDERKEIETFELNKIPKKRKDAYLKFFCWINGDKLSTADKITLNDFENKIKIFLNDDSFKKFLSELDDSN